MREPVAPLLSLPEAEPLSSLTQSYEIRNMSADLRGVGLTFLIYRANKDPVKFRIPFLI